MAKRRLIPDGRCLCGCGDETRIGSFFRSGHDTRAASWLIQMKFGNVPGFLDEFGYGPGGNNLKDEFENWRDNERAGE